MDSGIIASQKPYGFEFDPDDLSDLAIQPEPMAHRKRAKTLAEAKPSGASPETYSQCLNTLEDIKKLPAVGLHRLVDLPTSKGVYVLIDSASRILYIGQTSKGLAFRWSNHARLPQALDHDEDCRLHYQTFPRRTEKEHLLAVESAMISIFRPLWNGTTISNAAGDVEIVPASDLVCLGRLARDIVSAHLRPGYADRLDTVTAIELALEIGLKAVQRTTFPNLPEKVEKSQTR